MPIIKFEVTEEGEVFLPIPEETLKELGWKSGDLLELTPMVRYLDTAGEKQHVENIIHIRRARM